MATITSDDTHQLWREAYRQAVAIVSARLYDPGSEWDAVEQAAAGDLTREVIEALAAVAAGPIRVLADDLEQPPDALLMHYLDYFDEEV